MSVSQRPIAILLMAMGWPDSLDNVTPSLLNMQGGSALRRFISRSSAPMAMLNDSPSFLDTLSSVLTAHESSLCLTS
jgi:protoheme ferro-lyase